MQSVELNSLIFQSSNHICWVSLWSCGKHDATRFHSIDFINRPIYWFSVYNTYCTNATCNTSIETGCLQRLRIHTGAEIWCSRQEELWSHVHQHLAPFIYLEEHFVPCVPTVKRLWQGEQSDTCTILYLRFHLSTDSRSLRHIQCHPAVLCCYTQSSASTETHSVSVSPE